MANSSTHLIRLIEELKELTYVFAARIGEYVGALKRLQVRVRRPPSHPSKPCPGVLSLENHPWYILRHVDSATSAMPSLHSDTARITLYHNYPSFFSLSLALSEPRGAGSFLRQTGVPELNLLKPNRRMALTC